MQLARLVRYNVSWLEEGGSAPGDKATRWLFALCALLETPLHADTCATLRNLLRVCSRSAEPRVLPEASGAGEGGRGPDQETVLQSKVNEPRKGLAKERWGPDLPEKTQQMRGEPNLESDVRCVSDQARLPMKGEPNLASEVRCIPDQARLQTQARIHVLVAIAGAYFKQDEALARAAQFLQL